MGWYMIYRKKLSHTQAHTAVSTSMIVKKKKKKKK